MEIVLSRPDGLHLPIQATLQELRDDETLSQFAHGLIPQALGEAGLTDEASWRLAEALHQHHSPKMKALLSALLVLDAELHLTIGDKNRVLSLAGFLSYHSQLQLERFPPATLRLPPLNPDGHYVFAVVEQDHYLAVRMDIHPRLWVAGHVRIASGSPSRPAQRLLAAEERLDRQVLEEELVEIAVAAANGELPVSLSEPEKTKLAQILRAFIVGDVSR